MEVSEYLVGSPAFKAGDTGDPRMAGSIPVHLRQFFAAVMIISVALVGGAGPAHGAARLLAATPADGASLTKLDAIEFEFDTLLIEARAEVTITKLDGTPFEVSDISVDGNLLRAVGPADIPSGNYQISYSVQSSDGAVNEGSIRVSVDAPGQAFSGGLIALVAIALAMVGYMGLVFRVDKTRRPRPSAKN